MPSRLWNPARTGPVAEHRLLLVLERVRRGPHGEPVDGELLGPAPGPGTERLERNRGEGHRPDRILCAVPLLRVRPRSLAGATMRAALLATAAARFARGVSAAPPARPRPAGNDDRRDLTVVIPARDEAHRIGPCLHALVPSGVRVLVVDDGSTDDTARRRRARRRRGGRRRPTAAGLGGQGPRPPGRPGGGHDADGRDPRRRHPARARIPRCGGRPGRRRHAHHPRGAGAGGRRRRALAAPGDAVEPRVPAGRAGRGGPAAQSHDGQRPVHGDRPAAVARRRRLRPGASVAGRGSGAGPHAGRRRPRGPVPRRHRRRRRGGLRLDGRARGGAGAGRSTCRWSRRRGGSCSISRWCGRRWRYRFRGWPPVAATWSTSPGWPPGSASSPVRGPRMPDVVCRTGSRHWPTCRWRFASRPARCGRPAGGGGATTG